MTHHQVAVTRTIGLFVAGAGALCALLLWGVAATAFMEPVAFYVRAALICAALSAAGAGVLGSMLVVQYVAASRAWAGR